MIARPLQALLCDLDGTLIPDDGRLSEASRERLDALEARGVRVMLATGRSEGGVLPVLDVLELRTPALVYNGAALFCTRERRMLEERVLSGRTIERALALARAEGMLPVVMRAGAKFSPEPRDDEEERALRFLEDLSVVSGELPREHLLRITLFATSSDSEAVARRVEAALDQPVYMTHFPLSALPQHRESRLQVVDVQPPCRGKGEGLRILEERYGIPAERVVAVGDADNDLPMLERAGVAVAMGNATQAVKKASHRVIGDNNGDAIPRLLDELFG